MEENERMLKQFEPITCPCCKKDFYAVFCHSLPKIDKLFTSDFVQGSKEYIKNKLSEIDFFNPSEREEVINYVDSDEFPFIEETDREKFLVDIMQEQITKRNLKSNVK
jgi:hypothetical protein